MADAVNDRLLYYVCSSIITAGVANGDLPLILDSLEIECSREHRQKSAATRLWLELSDGAINASVLSTAINLAAGGDENIFNILEKRIGGNGLKPYLTFATLNMLKGADDAAVILFERYNVTNFYLIARPLITLSDWNHYESPLRRKILDHVFSQAPEQSLSYLLKFTPFKAGKDEVPELYLYYFLKLLPSAAEPVLEKFLHVVRHMPGYTILVRYPEIREAFRHLLESHPAYRERLHLATENLDFQLRFNASSILLACFPENTWKELENTIRAADKRLTDSQQWIRFCMKLNYSATTLSKVDQLTQDVPEGSRYYALFILYHQDYPLTNIQKQDLIGGLLGSGDHFDHDSNFMGTDGLKSVGQDFEMLPLLTKELNSENRYRRYHAGSQLYYFHLGSVTAREKAKVYFMECQSNFRALFNFHDFKAAPFNDPDFMSSFTSESEVMKSENGHYPLLCRCYQLIQSADEQLALSVLKSFVFDG